MIIEFGHFAFIVALGSSLMQAVYPLLAGRDALNSPATTSLLGRLANVTVVAVALSFLAVLHGFWQADFSIRLVATHGHSTLPLLYKLTALWGNHEGSMLLWVFMLSLFNLFISRHKGTQAAFAPLINRALIAQALLLCGFILFVLLTSNPFSRLFPVPIEGGELNPLLQDIALAAHPPLLYVGYVGFSAIFSYAVAALWYGVLDKKWAQLAKPAAHVSWGTLSAGITLGSAWAYYELGWGGFWFWDPVENASLIPWIIATAFIHTLSVFEKKGAFPYWTLFLALSCFCFSMVGTFLVRSGVLISVHSFASDPHRGLFILALIATYSLVAFTLFAARLLQAPPAQTFHVLSRESAIMVNNLLTTTLATCIFLGTIYPLIIEALQAQTISVGAPFFNHIGGIIVLPMMVAMMVVPLLRWQKTDWHTLLPALTTNLVVLVVILAVTAWWHGYTLSLAVVVQGTALALLVITLVDYATLLVRSKTLPASQHGMHLAHSGFAMLLIAAISASLGQEEKIQFQRIGESVTLKDWQATLVDVRETTQHNYISQTAELHFTTPEGTHAFTLLPEKRFYPASQTTTTEAAIRSTLRGDVYAAFDQPTSDSPSVSPLPLPHVPIWTTRLWFKPLVIWIWFSGALMVFAFIALIIKPRRATP